MPRPSKFSERRRQRALAILVAGGSRRTAAAVAGIDPATFRDWLRRGERGPPGGRWREFYDDVRAAEAGEGRLVGLPDDDIDDVAAAMRHLGDRFGAFPDDDDPPPEPPTGIHLKWGWDA